MNTAIYNMITFTIIDDSRPVIKLRRDDNEVIYAVCKSRTSHVEENGIKHYTIHHEGSLHPL